jgi:hypothetical protein
LAATIIRQFNPAGHNIVLHHFCTLHARTPKDDPVAGPRGLLRRLIAQLAIHLADLHVGSLTRLMDRELFGDVHVGPESKNHDDFNALCELFGLLLNEVPKGVTVFIIIDNASDFESTLNNWGDEITYVAWRLRGIGRPQCTQSDPPLLVPNLEPTVRIMMTFSMRSVAVVKKQHPADCISLDAEHEYEGDMAGW